jgi:hypothetical protein
MSFLLRMMTTFPGPNGLLAELQSEQHSAGQHNATGRLRKFADGLKGSVIKVGFTSLRAPAREP